ncbi:MAG: hypothetical protein ABWJ97_03835 [Thermoproteus sp.]
MQRIWVYAIAAVAAALVAAYAAYAVNTQSQTANTFATTTVTTAAPWWDRAAPIYGRGPAAPCPTNVATYPPAGWGRAGWRAGGNISAYPPTAKNITISMTSSQASLQLRLVGIVRGPSAFAEVVAGSGSIEAGGRTYDVVSAYGVAGGDYFALRIYAGNALIVVSYLDGVYRMAVQQLGSTQITIYYGNATVQIN